MDLPLTNRPEDLRLFDQPPKLLDENSFAKEHSLSRITEDSVNISQAIDKAYFL